MDATIFTSKRVKNRAIISAQHAVSSIASSAIQSTTCSRLAKNISSIFSGEPMKSIIKFCLKISSLRSGRKLLELNAVLSVDSGCKKMKVAIT